MPFPLKRLIYLKHHSGIIILVAILIILAIVFESMLLSRIKTYYIYNGDQVINVHGSYETVQDVLRAAGLRLRAEDFVFPALDNKASPDSAIRIDRSKAVELHTQGVAETFYTLQKDLGSFFAEINLANYPDQRIYVDGIFTAGQSLATIPIPDIVEIEQFKEVTINDGLSQTSVRTSARTVGEAIAEAGIQLRAADGIKPSLGSWLEEGLIITINRAKPLAILVDGQTIETHSHHERVIDVLAEAGISLIGQDFTRPSFDNLLQSGDTIQVVRVTNDYQLNDELIPFDSVLMADDEIELDQRNLISQGVSGKRHHRTRFLYHDGIEVAQNLAGEWIAIQPVNEVIGYGTKIVVRSMETEHGSIEYWRVVRMRVTSYTAASTGKSPGDPGYGITASGVPAGYGVVAIDPRIVPFRSYVYVPNYGIGFAGDTGGGIRGRVIDLGYDEGELQSWRGSVDVYYLTPVPNGDKINYLIPPS